MAPSWTDIIQAICSILGVVIMLIGFIFVFIQIKQLNNSIISNTNNYVYTRANEFLNFITTHKLKPYFYENKKYESDEKKQEIYTACELASCWFEFVFLEKGNYRKGIFKKWLNSISSIYKSSPILRIYLEQKKDWYSDEMIEYLKNLNLDIKEKQEIQ